MKIIVQKFGGTSVVTPEARVAVKNKVQQALDNGYAPVVVVSAMGRKGQPYATDTLINVLKENNLSVSPRELDLMMCCGEIISACVMAATLQKYGISARALTGGQAGIITDSQFGAARIKTIHTEKLMTFLDAGLVPVVCGFQGETADNAKFTTLGRGGSDTSAAALGAALNAELVEIYTDVEGIMTADPRIVKGATLLDRVSYGDVCEMAHQGAKVIHPRAVEIAMAKNIPLVIKSTFSDAPGTLISNAICFTGGEEKINEHSASGVTYIQGIDQFRVTLNPAEIEKGEALFDKLAKSGISVGCLNLSETLAMFAVYDDVLEKTKKVLKESGFSFVCNDHCAKVSVVGSCMEGVPGYMAKFVRALTDKKITILQTVDSDVTISAVIKDKYMEEAVNALHQAFNLE
jgi:aspartate kinase